MDTVEQAAVCALNPNAELSLKQQAEAYLNQVKTSPDGWQLCLEIFVKQPALAVEGRFFGISVMQDILGNRFGELDLERMEYIKRNLLEYMDREFGARSGGNTAEPDFLKNKFAYSLTLLFTQTYPKLWPTFFSDILAILLPTSAPPTNPRSIDMLLRIIKAIAEEISNSNLSRPREIIQRNNALKDAMREGDIKTLVGVLFDILLEYRGAIEGSERRNAEFVTEVLKHVGELVSWMNISLVVNEQWMGVLYDICRNDKEIRGTGVECLMHVLSKGMKPLEKLNLINMLNLTQLLGELDLSDDDQEFMETVARLLDTLGVELCEIYTADDPALVPEARALVYEWIERCLPWLTRFLGNEYDDTSNAVFRFLDAFLTILKKQKKQDISLSQAQLDFLRTLLAVVIAKMKYDEEAEWGGVTDDVEILDDEEMFLSLRKVGFGHFRESLKGFYDSIATLDLNLFTTYSHSVVISTFEKFKTLGQSLDWRELELALHVLYLFGEAQKGQMIYITLAGNMNELAAMIEGMVVCNVTSHPHPSISLLFFENVVRYFAFFEARSDLIPGVLEPFVDTRGLHQSAKAVRLRSWYLFHRFIKQLKNKMGPFVETVLSNIGDLLIIHAEHIQPIDEDGHQRASEFDSQIFLFEAVGMLISQETVSMPQQVEWLKVVLEPLIEGCQKGVLVAKSELGTLAEDSNGSVLLRQLHNYIMAIGSVAKGFPDLSKNTRSSSQTAPTTLLFKQATEVILMVLENLNKFALIRDAARFSFSRLVNCLGEEILVFLPILLNSVLRECTVSEVVDFLPFVGLIAHRFKPGIFDIMNELVTPLVNKIFIFLNQPPLGTDEAILLMDLRKTYLAFVQGIFNADLEGIFISELNLPNFTTILQSILHYASDSSEPSTQKTSFGILLKMVNAWTSSTTTPQQNGTNIPGASGPGRPLPGFDQFVYNSVVRVCFEVPMKQSFNIADGQSFMVFGEITSIQRTIYQKQGVEFVQYMRNVFLPSIRCPPVLSEQYLQALQSLEVKSFKKHFQGFIQEFRSQTFS